MKISEHFQKAKEDGYPWAQGALDNFTAAKTTDWEVPSLVLAITFAFTWTSTVEGYDYWNKVWESLQ